MPLPALAVFLLPDLILLHENANFVLMPLPALAVFLRRSPRWPTLMTFAVLMPLPALAVFLQKKLAEWDGVCPVWS